MSSLKLLHSGGNGVIIAAPSSNPAANRTITLNDNYAGDGSFVTANSSGNVGIGTSSPDQPLHIKSNTPYIKFEDDNDNQDWQIEARAFFSIYDVTDSAHRLAIDGDGNVGIGTTSPASKLHVDGANSGGAIVTIHNTAGSSSADTVTFNSATSISAAFTISTDGTYFLRIENPDGNAVRSSTALLTVSDAPAWTTSAGSLGSNAAGSSVSYTVAATDATSFAKTSGTFPGGVSLDTSTGVISGTESGATAETTYSFTITATDAEGQTADRAFSITITVGINNSLQFN